MRYSLISALLLSCLVFVSPVQATAPQHNEIKVAVQAKVPVKAPKITQVESLQPSATQLALINKYATQFNVAPKDLIDTIRCESKFVPDVQSHHFYRGEREKSFGLSQINLPYNPDVTYEQAIDPDFAIRFMAEKFSQGKQSLWSCWEIVRPVV